jgi:hypothetical protein
MANCPGPWDFGPNVLAVALAAIAAVVSMYAAYRTTNVATSVQAALSTARAAKHSASDASSGTDQ